MKAFPGNSIPSEMDLNPSSHLVIFSTSTRKKWVPYVSKKEPLITPCVPVVILAGCLCAI